MKTTTMRLTVEELEWLRSGIWSSQTFLRQRMIDLAHQPESVKGIVAHLARLTTLERRIKRALNEARAPMPVAQDFVRFATKAATLKDGPAMRRNAKRAEATYHAMTAAAKRVGLKELEKAGIAFRLGGEDEGPSASVIR